MIFKDFLCLEVLGTTWHRQQRLGQAAGLASCAFGRVPNRGGLGQSTILGGRQSSDPAAGTLQGAHRGRGGAPGWAMTGRRKWREKGAPKYWKPLKASAESLCWKPLKVSESVWKRLKATNCKAYSGLHFQNHIPRIAWYDCHQWASFAKEVITQTESRVANSRVGFTGTAATGLERRRRREL